MVIGKLESANISVCFPGTFYHNESYVACVGLGDLSDRDGEKRARGCERTCAECPGNGTKSGITYCNI